MFDLYHTTDWFYFLLTFFVPLAVTGIFAVWLGRSQKRSRRFLFFYWTVFTLIISLGLGSVLVTVYIARRNIKRAIVQITTTATIGFESMESVAAGMLVQPDGVKQFREKTEQFSRRVVLENDSIVQLMILKPLGNATTSVFLCRTSRPAEQYGIQNYVPGTLLKLDNATYEEIMAEDAGTLIFSRNVLENSMPHGLYMVFHTLRSDGGRIDGLFCIYFDMRYWNVILTQAKLVPLLFEIVLLSLFWTGSVLIALLQRTNEDLAEEKHKAEEATEAKSHFLANMSHEIRTPMNAIVGFSGVIGRLLMKRCLPEEQKQCEESIELITQSGDDLLTIINDILDFSKVESNQVEIESMPVAPKRVVEDILAIMRQRLFEKPNVRLEAACISPVPELILGDPTRLRQILVNLVGNSIKFTEQGTVRIEYGTESGDRIFFNVTDTGIGMTKEQATRIFQPFSQAETSTTRRFGGTGLGLPISKRLANLQGGDVTVTSLEGRGSTFHVSLPLFLPEDITSEQNDLALRSSVDVTGMVVETIDRPFPLEGIRVLIVEDGKVNQIVISAQLKEAGAEFVIADNGRIAVDLLSSEKDRPFDVVLMDMQMPVMDGYEATRELRRLGFTVPIIAITANALTGDSEKTIQAGCNDYLSKPIDHQLLVAKILNAVSSQ